MRIEDVWQDWKVEKKIGRGSYGTVYKCFKEENGERKYSAIKVISVPGDDIELQSSGSLEHMTAEQSKTYYKEIIDGFMRETAILESLEGHPNIVRIDDSIIVEDEDRIGWHLFIRMELLTDFKTYSCDRTFTEQDVIKMASDLGNALKACAEKNIIHRDIKPENIFVDENGTFKLGDFGAAKQLEHSQTALSRRGTPNYMAPEVLNAQKGDSRADIYSLGIVMYQLLNNNRLPFLDPNKQFITHSERNKAFTRRTVDGEKLPELPNVSPELNAIIVRATQFKKEDRFKSVNEFLAALSVFTEKGKSVKVRALRWSRRRKAAVATVAVLLALVIGVGIFAVVNPGILKTLFSTALVDQDNAPDAEEPVVYQVENSGHVEGVYSIDGTDYYATHDGFFKYDGVETIQLSDQPCTSDFSILDDKIFYTVIDKSFEEVEEIGEDKVTIKTAQCSCWVMDFNGINRAELFKYAGSGYVVNIIDTDVYYLDDRQDVNILAGNGKTLYVRSILNPEKQPTMIQEQVQYTLSMHDQYLFFNEYSSDDSYEDIPSFCYDYSTKKAKEISCHACSFGVENILDDNTLLLFCDKRMDNGDGSWSTYKYLGKYSIATDTINEIREGSGKVLNQINKNTVGLSLDPGGCYIFDKRSDEMTLLTNDGGFASRFLDSNTLLSNSFNDDGNIIFEMITDTTKKTAAFKCTSWFICFGNSVALYWKEEPNDFYFDNCASYDGVILLNELDWKEDASTFLVPATDAMLNAPITAYVRRTDYFDYKYINVRYGPDAKKYDIVEKIDDYSSVKRLSEKVDGWYLCSTDFLTGWIDGDYVFDGDLDNGGGDFEFSLNRGEIQITGYYGSDSDIRIPPRINHQDVTSIGDEAFSDKSSIKSIVIPEGVTKIGENAFLNCSQLQKVSLPSSLTEIAHSAFGFCENLVSVNLPDELYVLGDNVFGSSGLTEITVPGSLESVGNRVFINCENLQTVVISEGVLTIGERCFEDCTALNKVSLPSSLDTIDQGAFNGCSSLQNISFPDQLKKIEDSAFYGCSSLTKVILPDSVNYVGDNAFDYCDSLQAFKIQNESCYLGEATGFYAKVYGYADSTAFDFAEENGLEFKEIT